MFFCFLRILKSVGNAFKLNPITPEHRPQTASDGQEVSEYWATSQNAVLGVQNVGLSAQNAGLGFEKAGLSGSEYRAES